MIKLDFHFLDLLFIIFVMGLVILIRVGVRVRVLVGGVYRMTEEATNENPWPPDTRSIGVISRAAFEVDDYCRIVDILHKRFVKILKSRTKFNHLLAQQV